MFLETSNGYLVNTNYINLIYIEPPTNEYKLCSVKAKTVDGKHISLYKDKELQYCQDYIENLRKKIAINMR